MAMNFLDNAGADRSKATMPFTTREEAEMKAKIADESELSSRTDKLIDKYFEKGQGEAAASEPAAEELPAEARIVESTLQPDTRSFFGKVCEKVLGKDAADRLLIWQKEIGQEWAERKVSKAGEAVGEAEGKLKNATDVVGKRETDAANYTKGKEALGMKVSDEALASYGVEIDSLKQKQTAAKDKLAEKADALANKETRVQEYEKVIDGAKHSLDDRLALKMEVNNKALAERAACVEKNRFQAAENSNKMKGLREQRMGVETLMKAGLEGAMLKDAKATVADLQNKIDELSALNNDFGKQNEKISKEMSKFADSNHKLQGKRDKLFPPEKKVVVEGKAVIGKGGAADYKQEAGEEDAEFGPYEPKVEIDEGDKALIYTDSFGQELVFTEVGISFVDDSGNPKFIRDGTVGNEAKFIAEKVTLAELEAKGIQLSPRMTRDLESCERRRVEEAQERLDKSESVFNGDEVGEKANFRNREAEFRERGCALGELVNAWNGFLKAETRRLGRSEELAGLYIDATKIKGNPNDKIKLTDSAVSISKLWDMLAHQRGLTLKEFMDTEDGKKIKVAQKFIEQFVEGELD